MSDKALRTNENLPMHIHAKPGRLWLFWSIPMLANAPFLVLTGLKHPAGIIMFVLYVSSLVGFGRWMVHTPHLIVSEAELTMNHPFRHMTVSRDRITAWKASWGAFHITLTDGSIVQSALWPFVVRADRDRLCAVLVTMGLSRE